LIRNHAAIIASAKLEKFPEVRGPRNGGGGGGAREAPTGWGHCSTPQYFAPHWPKN